MICGSVLDYLDKAVEFGCVYCGKVEEGHIACPEGHYVCDTCHNRDSMDVIENFLLSTELTDPMEIAETAMSFDRLPMLGCQHAHIAGGALMAAVKNTGYNNITDNEIHEVLKRTAKQAHGGYCGLTGVCGIAPAIGACFAVLTGSRCGKDMEQRITMEAVTGVVSAITGLTGPSCCKAYVRISLERAVEYMKKEFGIEFPKNKDILCSYVKKHPHGCREMKCPYYDSYR